MIGGGIVRGGFMEFGRSSSRQQMDLLDLWAKARDAQVASRSGDGRDLACGVADARSGRIFG